MRGHRDWIDELRTIMEEGMEGLRSGDEEKVEHAIKKVKKSIDKFIKDNGPMIFGELMAGKWYLAGPEGRQTIEEGVKVLEEIHPEAARWARDYIEYVKEQEKLEYLWP